MSAIRHRVGINAPARTVYDAFATPEGITKWWTRDVEGDSRPGGKLAFSFGGPEPAAIVRIDELTPAKAIRWTCIEGPDEWKDTTITFELDTDGEETAVRFTHAGWREPVDFMHHCSTRWAYFLIGLKSGLEGGTATPW